jgi:rhamnose transport system substrate-binding protein
MKLSKVSLALASVLVLAAAACGGDDDDTAEPDATDEAPATEAGATSEAGAEPTTAAEETTPAATEAPDATAADDTAAGGGGGGDFSSILLPKCTGIAVFDQANEGAIEAATELGVSEAEFVGPASCTDSTGQIEFVTNAVTQGVDAIMISNNAGDQVEPAVQEAADAGIAVVAWDSPIPSGQGESLFVAQVDFDETGQVMADMATEIVGPEGGEIAILSASPDAANQNAWIASFEEVLAEPDYASLELVDTVYGNDDADESYNQALALIDAHPDLKLIMAPTTVGIAAAAKAMQDEGLCETVKVSGLGLPDEMRTYTENGCAPQFALWSFVDLGYTTFYAAHAIATGELTAEEGATFEAGRMGEYTIEVDPTRDNGLRIVMGPFTVYNESNVGE